jgi:glycosyltransferase involved in cell wall biosynthesis
LTVPHGEQNQFDFESPEVVGVRRKNLLFWGRLEPYKGAELLAEAFALAKSVDPELQLRVVGRGSIPEQVRTQLEALGASVETRWVETDELAKLLAWGGVMLLPYTSATQSGVAATALTNGIPCVTTAVGGLPEQVRDGVTGLVVPPNDPAAFARAITRISMSEELAVQLSKGSLAVLEREERWAVIAPRLLEQIDAVFENFQPGSPRRGGR